MFKNKYRIVTDGYNGYEVQFRRWFLPFYVELNYGNSHTNIGSTKRMIETHRFNSKVVEYVD